MRLRFFLTIFVVLSFTAMSVSFIHYYFFRGERLRLMQMNLEQNLTLLTKSDTTLSRKDFSQRGEKMIDQIIGDDKINMIVSIYGPDGKLFYENDNAEIFKTPKVIGGKFEEWETVEFDDYFVMYLTRPHQDRVFRVGMILNQSIMRWKYLNRRIYIFVSIIIVINMVISFFLTYLLFRPVSVLADKVNLMAEKIEEGNFKDLLRWFEIQRKSSQRKDEFNFLIHSLDKLAHKVSEAQRLTQKWSALMAHELKAPMTLLRMSIDTLVTKTEAPPEMVQSIETELSRLEAIIMDFLEWASAESDGSQPELHALPLAGRTLNLVEQFKRAFPETEFVYQGHGKGDEKVFCMPLHFDQVLNNLLMNAVKYGQGKVIVETNENSLVIKDNGKGIPERVLENFGKPFNKYQQAEMTGHGLGLAWVNTLSRKYNWKIEVNTDSGTTISLSFP